MNSNHMKEDKHFVRQYSWIGIIVIYLLSTPLRFIYEWLGEVPIVGLFAPINESIWPHFKLVFGHLSFYGVLVTWFFKKEKFKDDDWMTATAVFIFVSKVFIIEWYYT